MATLLSSDRDNLILTAPRQSRKMAPVHLVFLKKQLLSRLYVQHGKIALGFAILLQVALAAPPVGAVEFPGPVQQPLLAGPLSAVSVPWSDGFEEFLIVGDDNGYLNLIYHQFNDVEYGLYSRQSIGGDISWLGAWEGGPYGERGILALTANPDRLHFIEVSYLFPYVIVNQTVELPEDPGTADFIASGPDGEPQMAVTLPGIDQVLVLRELDGQWSIGQTLATGDGPFSLTAIDLDGDQVLEFVTADRGQLSGTLGIFEQQSDGFYFLRNHAELPGRVHQIMAEDFDLDGSQELVVSYSDLSQLDIMREEGNSWVSHHTLVTSLPADFFQILSLYNGDFSIVSSVETRGMMDFFHFKDAVWVHEDSYYVGCLPRSLAACDFNGDGVNEVACLGNSSHVLSILLGNTLPGFWGYPAIPLRNNPGASTVADFDGDGLSDLVVSSLDPTALSLYLREPNGRLSITPIIQEISFFPISLGAGNFLDSQASDLVAQDFSGNNLVVMSFESGAGFVTQSVTPFSSGLSQLQVADIDNDGHSDIFLAQTNRQQVDVLFGLGAGAFSPVLSIDFPTGAYDVAAIDLNQDSFLELVVADGLSRVWSLENSGGRTFGSPEYVLANAGAKSLGIADFDGDSDLDVVVGNFTSESLTFLENMNDGTLGRRIGGLSLDGNPSSLQCRDMTGDGLVDVIVTLAGDNGIQIVEAEEPWEFLQISDFPTSGNVIFSLVEDFNNDSRPDILNLDSELLLGLIMFNTERFLVSVDPAALTLKCENDEFTVGIQPDRPGPWELSLGEPGQWQTLAVNGQPLVGTMDYDDRQWILKFQSSDVDGLDETAHLRLTVGSSDQEEFLDLDLGGPCLGDDGGLPAIRWRDLPWPNPFNPRIHGSIQLDLPADVDAAVFDLAGRRVATLLQGNLSAGVHPLTWDGRKEGRAAAAGLYLLRIRSENSHLSRKIILLK